MKKRILCLAAATFMLVGAPLTVSAEHFQGSDNWDVYFDGDEMISNFTDAEMTETILDIQPGDSVFFEVNLKNDYTVATDWYMTNEVISTLEESVTVAEGGAYTYVLKYFDVNGVENILYDSEMVGGEEDTSQEGEGLHQATNALEEYYYLDTLKPGETGHVTLYVELEGETQGNDYQDTLAAVKMNFAVELIKEGTSNIVKTGDESPILAFTIVTLVSGIVLLVVALKMMKEHSGKKGVKRG